MGRVIAQVEIRNGEREATVSALVDTGASMLVLPIGMKTVLGITATDQVECVMADGTTSIAQVAAVKIRINGAGRWINTEAAFLAGEETIEPLLGYIPLEQGLLAVDMLGHRLVSAKAYDLK